MSRIALLSLRTIGSGVPLGRKNAFHTLASTPGRPCSPDVAKSAMIGTRRGAMTAIPFTVLSLLRPGLDGVAHVVDAPADQVLHHRSGAAIRHVSDLHAHGGVQQLAWQM